MLCTACASLDWIGLDWIVLNRLPCGIGRMATTKGSDCVPRPTCPCLIDHFARALPIAAFIGVVRCGSTAYLPAYLYTAVVVSPIVVAVALPAMDALWHGHASVPPFPATVAGPLTLLRLSLPPTKTPTGRLPPRGRPAPIHARLTPRKLIVSRRIGLDWIASLWITRCRGRVVWRALGHGPACV